MKLKTLNVHRGPEIREPHLFPKAFPSMPIPKISRRERKTLESPAARGEKEHSCTQVAREGPDGLLQSRSGTGGGHVTVNKAGRGPRESVPNNGSHRRGEVWGWVRGGGVSEGTTESHRSGAGAGAKRGPGSDEGSGDTCVRRKGVGGPENGARTAARFSVFKFGDPGPQPPQRGMRRGDSPEWEAKTPQGPVTRPREGGRSTPWTCWGPGGDLL